MNGASPKKTPERDSRSGSAGYILMWVLWGEIKFRTFLPPSWIIGTCHPSSIVNMFLILSSLHLSFSVGYSRTDYLGFISKDLIFLKSCGIYSRKKKYSECFGYGFWFILYVCSRFTICKMFDSSVKLLWLQQLNSTQTEFNFPFPVLLRKLWLVRAN